jgi:acyl carrier protein
VAESKLLEAIASAIKAEAESTRKTPIDADTRLVEDLDLDSIDIVGVTMRLEDRFHIRIDVEDIKLFRSVRDLMDQVALLLGKSAA